MDVEKALLDQNLVLGRIEGGIEEVKNLQKVANGRTEKSENNIKALELLFSTKIEAVNAKFETVDAERNKMIGRVQALKWIWGGLIFLVGIAEFVLLKLWG